MIVRSFVHALDLCSLKYSHMFLSDALLIIIYLRIKETISYRFDITSNMSVSKINGVLLLFIAFQGYGRGQNGPCKGPYGCCPNTYWNQKEGKCLECKAGYYWMNCNRTCPYPYYGRDCQQECTCIQKVCNFMTGCTKGDENSKTTATYINKIEYTINTHSAISTEYRFTNHTIYINYVKSTSNTNGTNNSHETSNIKNPSNAKYTMILVGSLVLGVVFIAYVAVHIVDRQRKKTMNSLTQDRLI
uniref:Uncharacterized protein LOC111132061 isoform X2 n=1 Tax=Crassostrea virginica TaxID=6565 RepID=A0A8B8E708_CRAVI|nr:uncharacterized protein LOC111132061 isoform X2 [Crassostrea virginica]